MDKLDKISELRREIDQNNRALLRVLEQRGRLIHHVRVAKEQLGLPLYDPQRQQEMIEGLVADNQGPYPDWAVRKVFNEIHHVSVALMEDRGERQLLVGRGDGRGDAVFEVAGTAIGARPFYIAGPCAVESEEQLELTARGLQQLGVRLLRGGAFKPRTSPYSFQGLGFDGLALLRRVADRLGMGVVTEVVDPRQAAAVADQADVVQVGCRNMFNYELLKELGTIGRPVLLKRGFGATIDEWLQAAEYLAVHGNEQIILCERGIRTFEGRTRATLDIAAVPLVRSLTRLPVVVDVSHAAGRRDLITPLTKAAFGAGAHGVMIEVHYRPSVARCDAQQQLSLPQFAQLQREVYRTVPAAPDAPEPGASWSSTGRPEGKRPS
jgi:3-deoxy-7-phosphoheptulonate synthase/chorismate mutase